MANVFDKFDAPTPAGNYFDKFDTPTPSVIDSTLKNLSLGNLKGASSIGATLLFPVDKALDYISPNGNGQPTHNDARRASLQAFFNENADPSSAGFKVGDLGSQVAGTGGIGGLVGKGVLMLPSLARYAPLLESGGFNLGDAATGSTLANTALRAGAGAIQGGLQAGMVNPDNAKTGALIGGVAPGALKLASVIGGGIRNGFTGSTDPLSAVQNSTRDATLKASQDAGYVIPPSTTNPSLLNTTLESISGKAATKQASQVVNQKVTDSLARDYLGLPQDTAFSPQLLDGLLSSKAAPYKVAAQLPEDIVGKTSTQSMSTGNNVVTPIIKNGSDLVNEINVGRDNARALWKDATSAIGTARNLARQQAMAADTHVNTLESQLETLATNSGNPDLVNQLRQARVDLAKVHTIDRAMNDATGTINAKNLAMQWNKNAPLDGGAKTIADFANAFPTIAAPVENIGSAGVSKLKFGAAPIFSGAGFVAGGPVGASIGAALPFVAPEVAKKLLLSRMYQGLLSVPRTSTPGMQLLQNGLLGIPSLEATSSR